MGLSLGIGTALAAKKRNQDYRTFVLMGDGEADEGSVWEGIMAAAQFGLDNLCLILDRNGLQLGGNTEEIMAHGDLCGKLQAFGWNAAEVDGHEVGQLYRALSHQEKNGRPTAVVAHTVKGKGFHFSENNNSWHHAVLSSSQYESALQELEESYYGNNK
jgi:transketolase